MSINLVLHPDLWAPQDPESFHPPGLKNVSRRSFMRGHMTQRAPAPTPVSTPESAPAPMSVTPKQPGANYRGNLQLPANHSANVSDEVNTSLFLTGLPPDCTVGMLLGSFRGTAKIYATFVNTPEVNLGHQTCAAKLVFFH
ncbi:Uu.00g050260.m01.CDS01 [Anthostomella pinea]|uniref:Uu.00g050260.m01.CDS01 n=1 Tax=Anthostomella pinea TaxID=933095 RepID=A0AAI8YMH9_9PEZI|nr:Uu.00g050260.m01.CDS01 [Anthostomella pinea]